MEPELPLLRALEVSRPDGLLHLGLALHRFCEKRRHG